MSKEIAVNLCVLRLMVALPFGIAFGRLHARESSFQHMTHIQRFTLDFHQSLFFLHAIW